MSVQSRHAGIDPPNSRRILVWAVVVAAMAIVLVYFATRDTDSPPQTSGLSQTDTYLRERADDLRTLVRRGEMPREALNAIQPDQTMSWDLNGDGATTDDKPVLRFDLDGDGRAEGVTEEHLMFEFTRRAAALDG